MSGGGDYTPTRQDPGEYDLGTYFGRSASAVQGFSGRIEREYARPAMKNVRDFFDDHPLLAVFLGNFTLLSFLPFLIFLGISFVTVVCVFGVALSAAFVFCLVVIACFFACLVSVLIATFFTAAFLTSVILGTYLLARLVMLVGEHGTPGIFEWVRQIKDHFSGVAKVYPPFEVADNKSDSTGSESPVRVEKPLATLTKGDESSYSDYSDIKVEGD